MESVVFDADSACWLSENCSMPPDQIVKETEATRAWFGVVDEREVFLKWYPTTLRETWARVEAAIAGASLNPAIVPLRRKIDCTDGTLLIFDRVSGLNLGSGDAWSRFQRLPVAERVLVVTRVAEALAAICDAGFVIVDWYLGNMIYDFTESRVWLFDWELCREGASFVLEMDSNYGSSKLMAPEEFMRGSLITQATLVFNLGRFALLTIPELAEPIAPILARATYPAPVGRYRSVREFAVALRDASAYS